MYNKIKYVILHLRGNILQAPRQEEADSGMNDVIFSKSFAFLSHRFTGYHYTDMTRGTTCYHIGYLKSGRAEFVSDSMTHEFSVGDVFFIPCGCKYRSYWYGDDEIRFDSYAFTYMPIRTPDSFRLQRLHVTEKAREYIDALSADKSISPKSVGFLYLFLGEVLGDMEKSAAGKSGELIAKARQYMLSHNYYSVKDIARHCKISESALYAAFRETAGHTPIDEKHGIQAEKAVRLLITTDMSVEEISDKLAFSSPSYMRKILKAKTGKTPREIRKEPEM